MLVHLLRGSFLYICHSVRKLLSNIYLDQLDRFIVLTLGYKYYTRYVDDICIVVDEDHYPQLLRDFAVIKEFVTGLELRVHPKKRYIQPIERGVEFLGAIVRPHRILAGKRTVTNFKQSARDFMMGKADETQLQSYLGRLKGFKGANLEKHVFEELGWDYPF